jgi:hypothetical protein
MYTARDVMAELPELPLEPLQLSGRLARSRRGPYVTVIGDPRPEPTPPPPPPQAVPRGQYDIRSYWAQVTYPQVICVFPGDFIDSVLDVGSDAAGPATMAPHAGHDAGAVSRRGVDPARLPAERHFKLSALDGQKLRHALFCTVKYGPWLAQVKETESCIDGVPSRWELVVLGIEGLQMAWYGTWLDQPTLPNLTVIKGDLAMSGHVTLCCPGNKWCPTTQSCIPMQVNCQPIVPA